MRRLQPSDFNRITEFVTHKLHVGAMSLVLRIGKDDEWFIMWYRDEVIFKFRSPSLFLKECDQKTIELFNCALGNFPEHILKEWERVSLKERIELINRSRNRYVTPDISANRQWLKETQAEYKKRFLASNPFRDFSMEEIANAIELGSGECWFRKGPDAFALSWKDHDIPWIAIWSSFSQVSLSQVQATMTRTIKCPITNIPNKGVAVGNAEEVRRTLKKKADERYAEMREDIRVIEYELAQQRIHAYEASLPKATTRITWCRVESSEYSPRIANRSEDKDRKQRLEFLKSLSPNFWMVGVGLGGVPLYDAAIFESKGVALVDCPIVGHALFAVRMDIGWKSWLEQTRTRIARLDGVTRVVHSSHWEECAVDALNSFPDRVKT
jgi:hypothetical protein